MREITVTALQAGQRLEHLLQRYLKEASGGFIYKMLRKKNITLNGHRAKGNEKVAEGDVIRLFFAEDTLKKFCGDPQPAAAKAAGGRKIPRVRLNILYEDRDILLIDKPAGMLTQKARPQDISLNEYAIDYLLRTGAVTEDDLLTFRPSVCNRLDRNTSGIVAVGKTVTGLQQLSEMFKDRTMDKYYKALVIGRIDRESLIDGWLLKDEKSNRVAILKDEAEGARRIRTRYVPDRHISLKDLELTLLDVELLTGRSHQIRAHLASIGHPIAGDPKYGNFQANEKLRSRFGVKSQLLHAGRLTFPEGDGTKLKQAAGRTFTAPLPEDFRKVLDAAGERTQHGDMGIEGTERKHPGGADQPDK